MAWEINVIATHVFNLKVEREDGVYVRWLAPLPYGDGFVCERITYKDGEVVNTECFLSNDETEETMNSYKIIKNE